MTAQQLKNAILQEAIQGRLVPQDPNDEPASVLLDKIRKEKQQLVKEGKLKKKDLEEKPISEDEIPFEIPEGWEWVRLITLSKLIHYGYTASAAPKGNSRLLRITDIQDDKVNWTTVPFCTIKDSDLEKYELHNRDILIARTGGTIGKTYIVRELNEVAVFASYLIRSIPLENIYEEYLKLFMGSPCYWSQLTDAASGTGQPNVNGQSLSNLIVPLPPLAEQKRIVAKIEELLPKVEKYGKAQEELNKLNEELPERLKKSILQEAIEGRLVPQDPNDEPASVLLDKIREEKKQLVKAGKLKKKDLEEKPISEDEIPFEIPESWKWCRLGGVCDYIHRGKSPKYGNQKELPIIAQKCNQWDKIYTDRCLFSDITNIEKYTSEQYLQVGDVIINSTGGGTVGRTGYVADYVFDNYPQFVADSHVTVVRGNKLMTSKYIYYFLISPYIQWGLEDRCSGSTNQIELGTSTIFNYIFPLPPLAEQKRIVEKIEQLFKEIDKLKK